MDDTAPALPTPRRFVPLALIALALAAASWVCSASLEGRSPQLADPGTGVPVTVPADRITEPQDTVESPTPAGEVASAEALAMEPPAATDQPGASSATANGNGNGHGPGGVSDSHASRSNRH